MIIIILISSKREKRHQVAKLYCAEWHNSWWCQGYVGPETVSREAVIEAYST